MIADLIERAVNSNVARLVRLADKVQDQIDQLEEQLREHERGRELRTEAERLERRLGEIRQQLNPKRPVAPKQGDVLPKTVRLWAKANGVACPALGRVPVAVLAAYRAAVAS